MFCYSQFPFRRAVPLVATLALAACSDAPTAAPVDAAHAPGPLARVVTTAEAGMPSAILVIPGQQVAIDLGEEGTFEGRLRGVILDIPGVKNGSRAFLYAIEPRVGGSEPPVRRSLVIDVATAELIRSGDGFVVELEGEAEVCASSGQCRTLSLTGTVQPSAGAGAGVLYATFHGIDLNFELSFTAIGKLIIPGEGPVKAAHR